MLPKMSLQNESFPNDEFLDDDLELSSFNSSGRRFQFPHHHREKCQHKPIASASAPASATNTSSSSSTDQTDQNLSSESVNGRPSSVLSSKTTASDPAGMADHASKKSEFNEDGQNKAASYQDIHSEYTKRRYKHVESKVAQYIANMKAEDRKRRQTAIFQRHRSMPETLSDTQVLTGTMSHFSVSELRKYSESMASDVEVDFSESMARTTSDRNRHESSDEASGAANFIDRAAYTQLVNEKERIQSYSDYLQTKLDDKVGENMRLQRNVDFMRIELGNAKDKLKKQQSIKSMTLGAGLNHGMGSSLNGMGMGMYGGTLGTIAHSLQSLSTIHPQTMSSKATQTDAIAMPPPPSPQLPPDVNNNTTYESEGVSKSGTTIQLALSLNCSNMEKQDGDDGIGNRSGKAILRQRSGDSNASPTFKTQKLQPPPRGIIGMGSHSFTEVDLTPPSRCFNSNRLKLRELLSPSQHRRQRARREEFVYYNKRTEHYAMVETLNASDPYHARNVNGENEMTTVTVAAGTTASSTSTGRGQKTLCVSASACAETSISSTSSSKKQTSSLRRRWLRLFGPCTRCKDPNQTVDVNTSEQRYTQIPLLEKSYENHCRNLR